MILPQILLTALKISVLLNFMQRERGDDTL